MTGPDGEGRPTSAPALDAEIREWFAQATAFHKAALLDEAAALYERILATLPGYPAVLHLLGVLRHAQGDFGQAVALLEAAVAAAPDNPSYHAALGAALRGADRPEAALAAYDRAIALRPDLAEVHNHRAIALQRLGRVEAAIEGYRAALAVRPDYAEAHNNLGTALRRAGRREEALGAYRDALAHRPAYVDALGNLGKLQAELGQRLEAIETYRQLLALRPGDVDGACALGDLLVVLDRSEEALAPYAAALDVRPRDPGLLDRLSVALLMLDRFEEAAGLAATAVGIDPSHAPAWLHYGIALEKLGQVEGATTALRTAIGLDPALPLAHFTLGMLCLATGAIGEAREIFSAWHRLEPDHPTARHMMAAVSGENVPPRASAPYIVEAFDAFAKTFDRQLEQLGYRAPQLIEEILRAHGTAGPLAIADLGCGTGLCAPLVRPLARHLVGVDLAPAMLDRARRRELYDELVEADVVDFLAASPDGFDLVIAADTLIYFGDLDLVIARTATALRAGGRFAFTLEEAVGEGSVPHLLTPFGRFQHAEFYVRGRLAAAGFRLLGLERGTLRSEAEQPVPGLVILAETAPGA